MVDYAIDTVKAWDASCSSSLAYRSRRLECPYLAVELTDCEGQKLEAGPELRTRGGALRDRRPARHDGCAAQQLRTTKKRRARGRLS